MTRERDWCSDGAHVEDGGQEFVKAVFVPARANAEKMKGGPFMEPAVIEQEPREIGEVKLTNDQEKADWLLCLQAAACMFPGVRTAAVARQADVLFLEEYRRRCR